MKPTLENLSELYSDTQTCAKLVGLSYVGSEDTGLTRVKHGASFSYKDKQRVTIADKKLRKRITDLVIPPAWQEVWICPKSNGHVLATGIDEKGRKQYIYHPKWRTMRDLIKFYRMIMFAKVLPLIRKDIDKHLTNQELSKEKVVAIMLWILDNAYIRIGNDTYFNANESVGLTTLTDKNVVIAGPVVTLSFKGKSGKDQQITFEHVAIAKQLTELKKVRGARLFRYKDAAGWHDIDASEINAYIHELTGVQVSAKDFRTWGGTLMAFMRLLEDADETGKKKSEKVIIKAVDQAAAVLGNTRTVARASYVHPHMLSLYGSKNFAKHYARVHAQRKVTGLDARESELLHFLELMFEEEFSSIKQH